MASILRRIRRSVAAGAVLLALAEQPTARGDEFVLTTGGRIRGTWLNTDERPRTSYQMRTEYGGVVSLDVSQVAIARRQSPAEREYDERMPAHGDTVEEQWRLAEWCREQGLRRQASVHLQRVVQLDPDDARAWRALGYVQLAGRWTTPQQHMRQQGFVRYDGRWRIAQDVQLLEQRVQIKELEGEWHANIKRWRSRLLSDKPGDAWSRLAAIRDPLAVRALGSFMARETHRPLKLLYIDVLKQIDEPRALAVLVATALNDADREVFLASADAILKRKSPQLVRFFVATLKDPNNVRVNRAAHLLGRMEDRSAIGPLIEALVTTHVQRLPRSEMLTVGFEHQLDSSASPGLSEAAATPGRMLLEPARGTQATTYRAANPSVLEALEKLSGGASLGYNPIAWQRWAEVHRQRDVIGFEGRRD